MYKLADISQFESLMNSQKRVSGNSVFNANNKYTLILPDYEQRITSKLSQDELEPILEDDTFETWHDRLQEKITGNKRRKYVEENMCDSAGMDIFEYMFKEGALPPYTPDEKGIDWYLRMLATKAGMPYKGGHPLISGIPHPSFWMTWGCANEMANAYKKAKERGETPYKLPKWVYDELNVTYDEDMEDFEKYDEDGDLIETDGDHTDSSDGE